VKNLTLDPTFLEHLGEKAGLVHIPMLHEKHPFHGTILGQTLLSPNRKKPRVTPDFITR
jgi:hypothetical protein